jgi:hypothetical protein
VEEGPVNKLTAVLSALAVLSLATERLTEVVKTFPGLCKVLDAENPNAEKENKRKFAVKVIAVSIGTGLATLTNVASSLFDSSQLWMNFVLGAMASSGSGIWNSTLDIVRQVNQQKQVVTDALKGGGIQQKQMLTAALKGSGARSAPPTPPNLGI